MKQLTEPASQSAVYSYFVNAELSIGSIGRKDPSNTEFCAQLNLLLLIGSICDIGWQTLST